MDIDDDVLKEAEKICSRDGYTIEEVITLLVEAFVKAKGFPFEIKEQ